jgi:hypothetical protein
VPGSTRCTAAPGRRRRTSRSPAQRCATSTLERAKIAPLLARLGPIVRDKPRDPTEAEYLRRIGTPERLIGPEA